MSDGKRRRFRKVKDEKQRPIILAKREESSGSGASVSKTDGEIQQPIILLKAKNERDSQREDTPNVTDSIHKSEMPAVKTIIVTRSELAQSPALNAPSPNITKEQESSTATTMNNNSILLGTSTAPAAVVEPVPQMTRPATVMSSTGMINSSARKLLMKANTDFQVVGVIGTQGVGKSTIMNLLANEQPDFDYYQKVFVEEDCIFPTKLKLHKCSARSRTESTHMFITSDRLILLDSPPVLCNSYKKDMTTNELDDLRNIISFLSVCHLLIVVQDDYFNMNFMRLLQFAELMKPTQDNKPFVSDYFPNLLFVKNRAKRQDFAPGQQERYNQMLKAFFKETQLRVFIAEPHGALSSAQARGKKGRGTDTERIVNSFLLPEVQSAAATPYHSSLQEIVQQLRRRAFMTPRSEMYTGASELTEAIWFELLTKVSQDTQHFFFNTYEEIQRKHLDVGNNSEGRNITGGVGGGGGKDVSKEIHENWRE